MSAQATTRPPLDWRKIEMVEPEMLEILRRKTPAETVAMAMDANETMRALIAGRLMTEHPDWSMKEVKAAVARRMLDAALVSG